MRLPVVGDTEILVRSTGCVVGVTTGVFVASRNLICAMCSSRVGCNSADSTTSDLSS